MPLSSSSTPSVAPSSSSSSSLPLSPLPSSATLSYYRVIYGGGLVVRSNPDFNSNKTGQVIPVDTIVCVVETISNNTAADSKATFLHLQQGGWIVKEKVCTTHTLSLLFYLSVSLSYSIYLSIFVSICLTLSLSPILSHTHVSPGSSVKRVRSNRLSSSLIRGY